MDKGSEGPPAD